MPIILFFIILGGEIFVSANDDIDEFSFVDGVSKTCLNEKRDTIILQDNQPIDSQLKKESSVYVINRDCNLHGGSVVVPSNCVLLFNGGRLLNGTIHFENTFIFGAKEGLFIDIIPTGIIANNERFVSWFGYSNRVHDYFEVVSVLVANPGEVLFEGTTYLIDKMVHHEPIYIESGVTIRGNGAIIDANYCTDSSVLFYFLSKQNILVRDISIACKDLSTRMPPKGHGNQKYSSSNVYAFYLVDVNDSILFINVNVDKACYGIKTSKRSVTPFARHSNIVIDNCRFSCDMPLQGDCFCGLTVRQCSFETLGKNDGLHCVYVLPATIAFDEKGKVIESYCGWNTDMLFTDCSFITRNPEKAACSIYGASDDNGPRYSFTRYAFFYNCKWECEADRMVQASKNVKCMLFQCELNNQKVSRGGARGQVAYYSCIISNLSVYKGEFYDSRIKIDLPGHSFLIGDKQLSSTFVIDNCCLDLCGALISSPIDNIPLIICNSEIKTTGAYLITVRGDQTSPIRFHHCSIFVSDRFAYCKNKIRDYKIYLTNCIIRSTGTLTRFLQTDASKNVVKIIWENSSFNGDIIG